MAIKTRPPRIDYTTDDKVDKRLNPTEQAEFDQIQAGFGESELSDREKAAIAGLESQFGDSESDIDNRRVDAASEVADRQESSTPQENGFYQPTEGKSPGRKQPLTLKVALRKGGPIGLIAALLGGFTFTSVFMTGPLLMLSHITENLIDKNDSAGVAQDVRLPRVFNRILSGKDYKSQLGKKGGRISNKGLQRLSRKGIVAVNADGSPFDTSGKKLYPEKQPTHYSIKELNGGKPIKREDLVKELLRKGNEKYANKAFGRRGAFKLRVKMWLGKHLKFNFLEKLGLKKDGGIARRAFNKLKKSERFKSFREKMPKFGTQKPVETIRNFSNKHATKAKKAGMIYTVLVMTCMAAHIPKTIAIGVAAVQVVQIAYLVWDLILTPHSKAKADGFGSGFTGEEADAIGTALTEKGITEGSQNTRGSALQSPMLLFAMGIIRNKQTVSDYAPGYSFFTNSVFQGYNKVMDGGLEATCNVITSSYAMWGTLAVEAVLTVATYGVEALISWAAKEAAVTAFSVLLETVIKEVFIQLLQEYAPNDMLPKARFKDLGDALGVSAMVFFSSSSMAQAIPTLKTSQLAEFNRIKIANEDLQKRMDLASLSPFDTSSKYTFLGNIVHNMGNMMLTNGTYDKSIISTLSNVLRLPSFALSFSSTAHAKTGMYSEAYCGYAKEFGQNGDETPAVNSAGLPCTGITRDQAGMSSEEAVAIAEKEGWLDEGVEVKEGATLKDLMESKYIKEDTPLRDFVESCTDASSGEYWVNLGGCTTPDGTTSESLDQRTSVTEKSSSGEETTMTAADQGIDSPATVKTTENRKMAAIPVLLMDFMIAQSVNGEDDDSSKASSSSSSEDQPTIGGSPYLEKSSQSATTSDSPWTDLVATLLQPEYITEEITEGGFKNSPELTSTKNPILPVEQTALYNAICTGHDWTTRILRNSAFMNIVKEYSIS